MDLQRRQQLTELFQRAARDDSGAHRVELYRALDGVELYFVADELELGGRPMHWTPCRTLEDGSTAMVAYSSKNHPDLPRPFGGTKWRGVLKVAYEGVRSDWLVIVNKDSETVAIAREQIPIIIADLEGREPDEVMEHSADELETTIANSVNAHSDDWYEAALQGLRGRELFLHLVQGPSPAQPAMYTSAAAGREGWILTYTTRRRPGIRYGGLRWEELVKIVKNDETIPGVRIVNDADDWILLGRDVI